MKVISNTTLNIKIGILMDSGLPAGTDTSTKLSLLSICLSSKW